MTPNSFDQFANFATLSKREPLASDPPALSADIQADFIAHGLAYTIGGDLPTVLAIEQAWLCPVRGSAQDGAGVSVCERQRQNFSFAQGAIRHQSIPFRAAARRSGFARRIRAVLVILPLSTLSRDSYSPLSSLSILRISLRDRTNITYPRSTRGNPRRAKITNRGSVNRRAPRTTRLMNGAAKNSIIPPIIAIPMAESL